jgi:hypothetical protein
VKLSIEQKLPVNDFARHLLAFIRLCGQNDLEYELALNFMVSALFIAIYLPEAHREYIDNLLIALNFNYPQILILRLFLAGC